MRGLDEPDPFWFDGMLEDLRFRLSLELRTFSLGADETLLLSFKGLGTCNPLELFSRSWLEVLEKSTL